MEEMQGRGRSKERGARGEGARGERGEGVLAFHAILNPDKSEDERASEGAERDNN
jgi:hypothetical protein